MTIITRRGKSHETTVLVRIRSELARPRTEGLMWNRTLTIEINLRRRPEVQERERSNELIYNSKEKKTQGKHTLWGLLKDFGDEIPPTVQVQEQANRDTESTVSTNCEELVATHELGEYPTMSVQDYRHDPKKEIAVLNVRTNCKVEKKTFLWQEQTTRIQRQCRRPRFHIYLQTLIEEVSAYPDPFELNCGLEDNVS